MRFLLADPHALTREGLKRVALDIDADSEFVEAASAATARAALRAAPSLDALLFDDAIFNPAELAALRRERPGLALVALTARDDPEVIAGWLAAGINALVPKSAPTVILGAALRLAMAGDVCVQNAAAVGSASPAPNRAAISRRGTGPLKLTPRQSDVLALIASGRPNKSIADELGIGIRTVKGHVSVILRALHADNRTDAGRSARKWLARGLLKPSPQPTSSRS
jgi:DNA-binding NarL/FixJ family response regulator